MPARPLRTVLARAAASLTLLVLLTAGVPAHAMEVIASYRLGEGTDGTLAAEAPATLDAATGELGLERSGAPGLVEDAAPRAREFAGSRASVSFNGESDGFRGKGLPSTQADNVAVEAWVRPSGKKKAGTIVQVGGGGGFLLGQHNGGFWGVLQGRGTVGFVPAQAGQWVHLALVIEGGKSTLYVDGKEKGSAAMGPWGIKKGDPFSIGGDASKPVKGFAGDIDEVRWFSFEPGTFSTDLLLYNGGQPGDAAAPAEAPAPAEPAAHPLEGEPGVDVLDLVFDVEPRESGLTFKRESGIGPGEMARKDMPMEPTWVVKNGNIPDQVWMRRMLVKVTDPRFRNGGRPAVDVEVVFGLDTWAGVLFQADTTGDDERKLAIGWGGSDLLKTQRFQIDDAQFAGEIADGWDLAIAGADAPLHVRSVRMIGYDPEQNVHWDRMLRIGKVASEEPGGVLAYPAAAGRTLRMNLRNLAFIERPLIHRLVVRDVNGAIVENQVGSLTLAGKEDRDLALKLDTSAWPLGPYEASLTLQLEESADPVVNETLQLGVVSDAKLAKARDGEFLFGLDAGNSGSVDTASPAALAWYDLMGVDVLRNMPIRGKIWGTKVDESMEVLKQAGLRSGWVLDPVKPNEGDAAKQEAEMQKKTKLLAEMVAKHGGRGVGQIHLVELGNEPDLPFFWPGEISSYVERMERMADAAHAAMGSAGLERGVDVHVFNGGLSFHGPDGDRRSREFIETVNPDSLDAIAYHAHGAGIEAERTMYEKTLAAAADAGITDLPLIETESGYSGTNPAGRMEQARTAVEKMLFAQSKGQPTLLFFRLFMDNLKGYSMTLERIQPTPSVMSYRTMAERLRHHRFVTELELPESFGPSGVIVYDFEEIGDSGSPTGRRTLVAWNTEPSERDVLIEAPGARDLRRYDLFGNPVDLAMAGPDRVRLPVGINPGYLTWEAGTTAPRIAESLLTVSGADGLLTGTTSPVAVRVNNPLPAAADLTLEATIELRPGATVNPTTSSVRVPGGQSTPVELAVAVEETAAPLALPAWWTLFLDADPERADPASWTSIPETLRGAGGGTVEPRYAATQDGRLDLAGMGGGAREKKPAIGFATLDSPSDVVLPVAAMADWWMAWYVNGEEVYSTMTRGNRHGNFADHTFEMPLKKGRNVIAFVLLSGAGGWSIDMGGPAERQLALDPDHPLDHLDLRLLDGTEELASQGVAIRLVGPVPPLGDTAPDAALAEWLKLDTLAAPGEQAVTNFFVEAPDQSRWYRGPDDLSAVAWLRRGADGRLHLVVGVRDDDHEPAAAGKLDSGDRLRVRVQAADGALLEELTATTAGASGGGSAERLASSPLGPLTLYRVELPASLAAGGPFGLELRAFDRDGGLDKQVLDAGPMRLH